MKSLFILFFILQWTLICADELIEISNAVQSSTLQDDRIDYVATRAIDNSVQKCSKTTAAKPRWWKGIFKRSENVSKIQIHDEDTDDLIYDVAVWQNDEKIRVCEQETKSHHRPIVFLCGKNGTTGNNIQINDNNPGSKSLVLCDIKVYEYEELIVPIINSTLSSTATLVIDEEARKLTDEHSIGTRHFISGLSILLVLFHLFYNRSN